MSEKIILKVQAYETIKAGILSCEYMPGTKLNEEILQEKLHISRTPIRDALGRLEQEGLITIMPKRGILVSPVSIDGINAVYEARELYETYALKDYGHALSGEELLRYREIFLQPETVSSRDLSYRYDDEFHNFLISTVNNEFLLTSYTHLNDRNHRYRVMSGSSERLARSAREHVAVIDACLAGNYIKAAEEMHRHLLESKLSVISLCK